MYLRVKILLWIVINLPTLKTYVIMGPPLWSLTKYLLNE